MSAQLESRRAYAAPWVFDGDTFLKDHAVVVQDGAVCGVWPVGELAGSMSVQQFDGCTITPGLIDTHVHFMRWQGPAYLAYGVTAIRDVGNDLDWILDCQAQWEHNDWPRIFCLGPLLDGAPAGHPLVSRGIVDRDDGVAVVREIAHAGTDGIKLYAHLDGEWIAPMVEQSHALGLKVSMHCASAGVLAAARGGVDEFFHLDGILADVWPDRPPGWLFVWGDPAFEKTWDRQREVADAIAESGIVSTPTFAYWDTQWRMRLGEGPHEEERRYAPAEFLTGEVAKHDEKLGDAWRRGMQAAIRFQGLLNERGVPALAGTDAPFGGMLPGQSLWREMLLLNESGLSPLETLRSATSAAADFLERPELGRLQTGCVADLVVVKGDLASSIPDRPTIKQVLHGNEVHQPDQLLQHLSTEDSSWRQDPWGRQFIQHWANRAAAGL